MYVVAARESPHRHTVTQYHFHIFQQHKLLKRSDSLAYFLCVCFCCWFFLFLFLDDVRGIKTDIKPGSTPVFSFKWRQTVYITQNATEKKWNVTTTPRPRFNKKQLLIHAPNENRRAKRDDKGNSRKTKIVQIIMLSGKK